jgi:uncharacterized membrane protein
VADTTVDFGRRSVDRLVFFSDAVVAIAITLLALNLPVPRGADSTKFWSSVRHNDGHYLAFAISFLVIAAAWNHHHQLFAYARSMDSRLRTLNTAWLLAIILNPFATKLLTSQGNPSLEVHAILFGFYALTQSLNSAALLTMSRHMIARDQVSDMPPSAVAFANWDSAGLIVGFGLSIPVFFLTSYGWVLWFTGPLVTRQVYRLRTRKTPRRPASMKKVGGGAA